MLSVSLSSHTPRPGWKDFLRETASKYEMHVYTMGTRAYAEQVCAAIDPDSKIFGGRLLSRDESGSGLFSLSERAPKLTSSPRSNAEKLTKTLSL